MYTVTLGILIVQETSLEAVLLDQLHSYLTIILKIISYLFIRSDGLYSKHVCIIIAIQSVAVFALYFDLMRYVDII